ncbi:hypothetical protein [Chryseobacterium populi]|uniref:Uncharacterized protein n=1 Tax=Chryseobacterium populi TaxID=1144316 RepID=J2T8E7_9FLAO|nr:hypothetical protein [Chryseobacterium populi]EJL74367.1 hypothetical protein PMI13_01106 [Chryseobacterium populi]
MKRELPVITIEGTEFMVDVNAFKLHEKDNPENVISFEDMRDVDDGYVFSYSPGRRNIPPLFGRDSNRSITVKIPEWVALDPVGMAEKYGLTPEKLQGKTDFDVMVDQEALNRRINEGMLPTVRIADHIFYVDLRMNMLRPKDDFASNGIVFSEIESYNLEITDEYLIPYNPLTHEFQDIDCERITEYPKDLIAVRFPCEWVLDPIGWNRCSGMDELCDLKYIGPQSHFNAETIPWEKTFLCDIIKENRLQQGKQVEDKGIQPDSDEEQQLKKGCKR